MATLYKPKRDTTPEQARDDVMSMASPVGVARSAGRAIPGLAAKTRRAMDRANSKWFKDEVKGLFKSIRGELRSGHEETFSGRGSRKLNRLSTAAKKTLSGR